MCRIKMEVRMLKSVNSVSFNARNLYDKPNTDAPQVHQRPQEPMANHPRYEEPKKSSHKVLKTIAGLVATAAVAVGAVAIGSKMGWLKPDKIKSLIPEKILNADWAAAAKEPVKKGLAAIENFGNSVAENVNAGYDATIKFFENLIPKKS